MMPPTRTLFALAFACAACLPGGAVAQEAPAPLPDPETLAAVLDTIADPGETAEEIGQQLTACLRPLYGDELRHAPIVFSLRFDEDGRPTPPELFEPTMETATRPHLRQLFRAESAIFDCVPVTAGGLPVADVTLLLRADEESIAIHDAPAAETGPEADPPIALGRDERRETQVRLRLAGHNPGGADGVFGPRSRAAISDWQSENGYATTGVLTRSQHAALMEETETAYSEWREAQPAPTRRSGRYYRDRDGCLRYADGRVVPNQSFKCDVKGLFSGR